MRLLIAADIFPPDSGGPATYAVTLANELTKLGVSVSIVSLNPNSDAKVLDPKVKLVSVSTMFKPLRYWQYYNLLKQEAKNCDVIYAMGPVNAGYPALKVAQKLGKKFVVKVVGDYAWEQGQVAGTVTDNIDEFQKKSYGGKIGWLQKIEREVVNRADVVITPAEYLKNLVIGWGADKEKVKTIFNILNTFVVEPEIKPNNEIWIVSVGRLVPWKGMDTLISIMPDILEEIPQAKLIIIGDGPLFGKLGQIIKKFKLQDSIKLTGNLTRAETLAKVHAANLFVLNSGYEGISHAILEAMSYLVPVIASNAGGTPEIVVPGLTGQLFDYNNANEILQKIINHFKKGHIIDGMLRQEERINFWHNFKKDKIILDTKKILESLCAN